MALAGQCFQLLLSQPPTPVFAGGVAAGARTCVSDSSFGAGNPKFRRSASSLSRNAKSTVLLPGRRQGMLVRSRIQIDRRRNLEEAYKRQQEADRRRALLAVSCPVECVREVKSLVDLEAELAAAERQGELVVVDFFDSSCGACKDMLPQVITLCKNGALDSCFVDLHELSEDNLERIPAPVPARFLKHNVRDDYDDLTDIARMYRIKVVPAFAFFLDGSRISQLVTRNSGKVATLLAKLAHEKDVKAQQ